MRGKGVSGVEGIEEDAKLGLESEHAAALKRAADDAFKLQYV